jgi:hypothetical protein
MFRYIFLVLIIYCGLSAQGLNESPHLRIDESEFLYPKFKTLYASRRSQSVFLSPGELASPLWSTSLNGQTTKEMYWLNKAPVNNYIHVEWGNEVGDGVLQESKTKVVNNYVPMVNLNLVQKAFDHYLDFNFSAVDHGSTQYQVQRNEKMRVHNLSNDDVAHRTGNLPDHSIVDLKLEGDYAQVYLLNQKYWLNNFGQEEFVDHKGLMAHFNNEILSTSLAYHEMNSTEINYEKYSWIDSKVGVDFNYFNLFLKFNSNWSEQKSSSSETQLGYYISHDSKDNQLYHLEFEMWQDHQMKGSAELNYDLSLFEIHIVERLNKDLLPNQSGFFLDSDWRDLKYIQNSLNLKVYKPLKKDNFSSGIFTGLNHYASDLDSPVEHGSLNWNGSILYLGSHVELLYKSSQFRLNLLYQSPQLWKSGSTHSLYRFKGVAEWEQDWSGGLYTKMVHGSYNDSKGWFQKLDVETNLSLNKKSLALEMTLVNLFGSQLSSRDRFSLYLGINYFPSW